MSNKLLKGICLFLCVIVPFVGITVYSFIEANKYIDAECGIEFLSSNIKNLAQWLNVNTIMNIIYALMGTLFLIFYYCSEKRVMYIVFLFTNSVYFTLICIWSIVGMISLFEDKERCIDNAYGLWVLSLITCVVQSSLLVCTTGCYLCNIYSYKKKKKYLIIGQEGVDEDIFRI